jgi:hypothetical protein
MSEYFFWIIKGILINPTLLEKAMFYLPIVDLSSSNPGWIYENLSSYTEKLPIDPQNDEDYFYSYNSR